MQPEEQTLRLTIPYISQSFKIPDQPSGRCAIFNISYDNSFLVYYYPFQDTNVTYALQRYNFKGHLLDVFVPGSLYLSESNMLREDEVIYLLRNMSRVGIYSLKLGNSNHKNHVFKVFKEDQCENVYKIEVFTQSQYFCVVEMTDWKLRSDKTIENKKVTFEFQLTYYKGTHESGMKKMAQFGSYMQNQFIFSCPQPYRKLDNHSKIGWLVLDKNQFFRFYTYGLKEKESLRFKQITLCQDNLFPSIRDSSQNFITFWLPLWQLETNKFLMAHLKQFESQPYKHSFLVELCIFQLDEQNFMNFQKEILLEITAKMKEQNQLMTVEFSCSPKNCIITSKFLDEPFLQYTTLFDYKSQTSKIIQINSIDEKFTIAVPVWKSQLLIGTYQYKQQSKKCLLINTDLEQKQVYRKFIKHMTPDICSDLMADVLSLLDNQ